MSKKEILVGKSQDCRFFTDDGEDLEIHINGKVYLVEIDDRRCCFPRVIVTTKEKQTRTIEEEVTVQVS
jgi:hypothetical protein